MKKLKLFIAITLISALVTTQSSCVIIYKKDGKHDNGKHKGWFKNSNNPHHPHSTNPGKGNGKGNNDNGNGKGNGNGNGKSNGNGNGKKKSK